MPVLDLRGFLYVLPVKATVMVVDSAFHAKGDVNRDGYIDAADLDLLKAAFGSVPGKPNWNPDCDLNGDGVVDITDIATCAHNQGQTAPAHETPSKVEVSSGKCAVIGIYRTQKLKREFTAGTRVAFVFTALGMLGRVVIVPI